jgi:predicted NUDIX family NTP pyrophosphohydrolase
MPKRSAGLLLFRTESRRLEVLLVHPGGPLWARKDEGAWSIPKGELEGDEVALDAARREFQEEMGVAAPAGEVIALEPVRQAGGKLVHAWALRGDFDPAALRSGSFSMEWPPRSGEQRTFPEVDRAEWLPLEAAMRKILKGQVPLLLELAQKLAGRLDPQAGSGPEHAD